MSNNRNSENKEGLITTFNLDKYTGDPTLVLPPQCKVFNFDGDLIRRYKHIVFPKGIKEINGDFSKMASSDKKFTTTLAFHKDTDVKVIDNILEPYYKKEFAGKGKTVRELIESSQIKAVGDISYALDIVIGGGDYKAELDKLKTMKDVTNAMKDVNSIKFSIITY